MSRAKAFGRYELLGRISTGGMAEVFRALDPKTGTIVALKRLLPEVAEDAEFLTMFEDEARIASQLEHPYIARMLDYGRVEDAYYIAFEFVDGKDVRTLFNYLHRKRERIPVPVVVYILSRVAEGLAYAHARKDSSGRPVSIIHRDVSPQNVMVSFAGDVKLIDFGIAKAAGKLGRTQIGTLKGKFGYMAPEQVRSSDGIDQRVDVFALGICGWELLTMERLFEAQNELLVLQKLQTKVVPPPSSLNSEVPVDVDRIILKCLAKSPDERYRSARELYRDLNHVSKELFPVVTREQIAQYMRRTFQEGRTDMATNGGELMTDKGQAPPWPVDDPASDPGEKKPLAAGSVPTGSDLDVFENLGRKQPAKGAAGMLGAGGAGASSVPPIPGLPGSGLPSVPGVPTGSSAPGASGAPGALGAGGLGAGGSARPGSLAPDVMAAKRTLLGIPAPAPNASSAAGAGGHGAGGFGAGGLGAVPPPPPRNTLPPIPAPAAKAGVTPPTIVPRGSAPAPASSAPVHAGPPSSAPPGALGSAPPVLPPPTLPPPTLPPPSMPPMQARGPSKAVSMEWDEDDDEATHIFDKSLSDEVAKNLSSRPPTGAAGGASSAPPSSHAPSSHVPPAARTQPTLNGTGRLPSAPSGRPEGGAAPAYGAGAGGSPTLMGVRTAASAMESTALVRPHGGRSITMLVAGGVAAAAAAGIILFLMMPRVGRVVINVADVTDPKGTRLNHMDIAVDGRKQCDTTPCIVDQVAAGSHVIKVVAPGFEAQEPRTITVEPRRDTIVELALTPSAPKVTTTLKVGGHQSGVHLYLNDKDLGPLPQEVRDLAPGPVKVRLAGDRYLPIERTVTLTKDEILDLGAQSLKVVKGKATVSLETAGARVFVVSGNDRRELPTLPISVDIDTARSWSLEASKAGFVDYKQPISFDDGVAEKTFTITLEPKGAAPGPAPAPAPARAAAAPRREAPAPQPAATKEAAAPAADTATGEAYLNINSLPPSSVVLDGKPIGTTPRVKVAVSPGTHTVLFVNADEGLKKQVNVTLSAGETKAAFAKLRD